MLLLLRLPCTRRLTFRGSRKRCVPVPLGADLDDQQGQQGAGAAAAAQATNDADAHAAASAEGGGTGASVTTEADDPSFFTRGEGEGALTYAARVFERVYNTDIVRLCGVKVGWVQMRPQTSQGACAGVSSRLCALTPLLA